MMKTKIVVIVGPTAVGKSDYAVKYALKHNGEVISADSRQVYRGLDLGTGKISKKDMLGVPHHLIDVADPKKQFNVEQYKELAQNAISKIVSKGKLPIICGGTGFYIDALINNISYPSVPHNKKLRSALSKMEVVEVFNILQGLDTKYAKSLNNSERHNKQRLIRSVEVATALGRIPKIVKGKSPYKVEWIKISLPEKKLKERINVRLLKRIDDGMIKEVKKLHKNGLSWKRMEALGLEYRYISRYLRGILTKDEMIEELRNEIWHYAKRQILWFKKIK